MGFRFRKSVKVAPGVRVNLNKKSASVSVGGKGARYTVSSTGRRTSSVGIPGTGVSYVKTHTAGKKAKASGTPVGYSGPSRRTHKVSGVIMIVLAILCFLIGVPTAAVGGWFFILMGVPCLLLGRSWLKKAKQE